MQDGSFCIRNAQMNQEKMGWMSLRYMDQREFAAVYSGSNVQNYEGLPERHLWTDDHSKGELDLVRMGLDTPSMWHSRRPRINTAW